MGTTKFLHFHVVFKKELSNSVLAPQVLTPALGNPGPATDKYVKLSMSKHFWKSVRLRIQDFPDEDSSQAQMWERQLITSLCMKMKDITRWDQRGGLHVI